MQLQYLTVVYVVALASLASAQLTYSLNQAPNPSADQLDAYARIKTAMDAALARHKARGSKVAKKLTVEYNTGVVTADGNTNGNIRFGADRTYMSERTALHEISHTLGMGLTAAFNQRCAANDWPTALPLMKSFDGSGGKISCGGTHFWPYGLNYENEMSEVHANRHVDMINAMVVDGI